jgi:Tol biopolymer transport system component
VLFHLPRGKGADTKWDLWTAPLAGGQPTLLREDAGFARYAPDGSIVFLDHPANFVADEIWTMDDEGRNPQRLVDGVSLGWPQVSPDGTMIAFGASTKVAVVDIATGDVTELDASSAAEPAWYGNDTLIVD